MTRHARRQQRSDSAWPASDEATAIRRRKTARRISRMTGLVLAVAAAAVMYIVFVRPAASHTAPVPTTTAPVPTTRESSSPTRHPGAGNHVILLQSVATLASVDPRDSVEISPDGKVVVAITADGQVDAWSTSTQQPLTIAVPDDGIPSGSQSLSSPTFSADGSSLAAVATNSTGGNSAAVLWDMTTGRSTVLPVTDIPNSVTPGPNGTLANVYSDKVILENGATGQATATLPINRAGSNALFLSAVIFSPDGRTIAADSYTGTAVYLWDVTAGGTAATLNFEKIYNATVDQLDSIAFSRDSRTVACGSASGIIRVWDVATKRNVATFTVNGYDPSGAAAHPVKTLIFSPDGKSLITADGIDNILSVWNVASGRKIATLTVPSGTIASAAFTSTGKLLVVATDISAAGQKIELWTTGKSLTATVPGSTKS